MSIAFVHLSDIHFGQETGGRVIVHNDVKNRLVEDVERFFKKFAGRKAAGIIVTGDIAFSGKPDQYKEAGRWLDSVAKAAACEITDILVVPGNHDIDRDEISQATAWMLSEIVSGGETRLDSFLAQDSDRELLYNRFRAYRPFAEGYDCPLDNTGGMAGNRPVELTANKSLRFIGLNSALICSQHDKEGGLILGARQRVLPVQNGEELVVLCHHPLHWLQDSDDARRYVMNRARIFISGHEHSPSAKLEGISEGYELLMISAGAVAPPAADAAYNFVYNILEFEWSESTATLIVTVHPRAWSDEKKSFEDDPARLTGHKPVRPALGDEFGAGAEADAVGAILVEVAEG